MNDRRQIPLDRVEPRDAPVSTDDTRTDLGVNPDEPPVPATDSPPPSRASSTGRAAREIVETLLLALVIFVGIRLVIVNFRVDGDSMQPALRDSQLILVSRLANNEYDLAGLVNWIPGVEHEAREWRPFGSPQRGDIVVFYPPGIASRDKPYIKRVIGLPGDSVTIQDGSVYINDERLSEPYVGTLSTNCFGSQQCINIDVPPDHLFVLGDNRGNSSDSRTFGVVAEQAIIGQAWLAYWPLDRFGFVSHESYPSASAVVDDMSRALVIVAMIPVTLRRERPNPHRGTKRCESAWPKMKRRCIRSIEQSDAVQWEASPTRCKMTSRTISSAAKRGLDQSPMRDDAFGATRGSRSVSGERARR